MNKEQISFSKRIGDEPLEMQDIYDLLSSETQEKVIKLLNSPCKATPVEVYKRAYEIIAESPGKSISGDFVLVFMSFFKKNVF